MKQLHPYLADVLLLGWGATLPPGVNSLAALPPSVRDEVSRLWFGGAPEAGRLWRLHEAELRAEAATRGLVGRVGAARQFYGEVCAGMGTGR
ncbi:MAG: hypothetical protein IMZ67_05945 [Acidobacteria bacterium]|nr:hypothetical protein [Acidobacteriota bacterium]